MDKKQNISRNSTRKLSIPFKCIPKNLPFRKLNVKSPNIAIAQANICFTIRFA
jgi:hypothetical protein